MSFESICLAQQLNVGGGGSDRPASFQEQMSEMGPKAKYLAPSTYSPHCPWKRTQVGHR